MGKCDTRRMELMTFPKRGEIYLVSLDPKVGAEIGKLRPALIISNDINNEYADTVTVLPITSNTTRVYPFEVFIEKGIGGLPKDSKIKCEQIRTIDKSRLTKMIGQIDNTLLKDVEKALLIHLGIEK
jgi:mRNA interferase MazF